MSARYVLVVDDDAALRETVCELLEEDGFRAIGVDSGASALQRLRADAEKPEVILLDLMMPVMNGWQFREEQLRDPELAQIPVVVMTASRNLQGIKANEVVYKPLKLNNLLNVVKQYSSAASKSHLPPVDPPPRVVNAMPAIASETLFIGDSNLARLMRALDWSKTALGPPNSWPDHWRTSVRLCLTSRIPVVMYLGPAFTVLYNDAYISFLGDTKHPACLGRPGSEVWSEIWETIGPMLAGVYATGKATWSEDVLMFFARNIPLEEVYVRFTFGPIFAADGKLVDGIFCPCTETTEQVVGARRLETLRKLGTRATESRTVANACKEAARVLGENVRDLPFAALYLLDSPKCASLCARAGLEHADPLPLVIDIDGGRDSLTNSLATVLREGVIHEIPLSGRLFGFVDERSEISNVLAIPIPGAAHGSVAGLLVAGVSSRRVLDPGYRAFFDLVAGHIGSAIAESKAYEDERKRAEALAELDRAKTAFFSNISHEFRTPLTLMIGPTEDLLSGAHGEISERQQEQLELLHRNELRLQKLVNSLLDFSRIEAGRIQASYEPTDLARYTRELASAFHSAVERAGLALTVDCPPVDEPIYVDRDMWEKIVLNLLSNAFKFTFEGRIEISLRSEGTMVALRVADTGVGVAEADVPHLFDRFHRIEGTPSRTHEGSGIGLALVQELAKLHGGSVEAQSQLGVGTTFTVYIPIGSSHLPEVRIGAMRSGVSTGLRAEAFVEEALRWLPSEPPATLAVPVDMTSALPRMPPDQRKATVLLADDNADMREYVRRILEPYWQVIAVEDGTKAFALACTKAPDLVLTDVMMPGLDGFALLRELRKDERTKFIPVVMLSARAGEESRVEGLHAGADDYLVKPFSARELVARVKTHLELARLREDLRKQNERLIVSHRQIQASEKKLRQIVSQLQAGLAHTDLTGRFTLVNERYRELVGRSEQELLQLRMQDITHPDDVPHNMEQFQRLVEFGTPFALEKRLAKPDGSIVWVQICVARVDDDEGRPTGVAVVLIEITQRKFAETALRESEERFRNMADNTPVMVWLTESDGTCTYLNQRWYDFTGQTPKTGLGFGWVDAIHPEDRDLAGQTFVDANEKRAIFRLEYRLRRHDGEYRWVIDSASPRKSASGEFLGYIGSVIDITERHILEDQLRLTAERLNAAQNAATIGVYDWWPQTGEIYWSPELCGLLGLDPSFPPSNDAWMERMYDEDRARVMHEFEQAVAERLPTLTHEYRMCLPNGDLRWLRTSRRYHYDASGTLTRVIGAAVDVHRLKEAAESERSAREEAERAARFSEMFAGILGHDLRNPLSAIKMSATLLQARADSDKVAKPVGRIVSSANRMERMISQLLDFARIRLGRGLPLEVTQVDLAEIAKVIVDELQLVYKREIILEFSGDMMGTWDRDRLSQLLSNLVANACQHGEPRAPVMIQLIGSEHEYVNFEVRNQGAIPPEILPVIFEPLRQSTDRKVTREGSSGLGLGLYITQQIAKAHGGSIRVESDEEQGTRFFVNLPRYPTQAMGGIFSTGAQFAHS